MTIQGGEAQLQAFQGMSERGHLSRAFAVLHALSCAVRDAALMLCVGTDVLR